MDKKEQTLWGIHAGQTGDADSLFLKHDCVALGWYKMGDLSGIKADRDAFKHRLAQVYPEKKPRAVSNNAGQLFRFVHEIKTGDLIAYPSKAEKQIHLGRVEGNYVYDAEPVPGYPHHRAVKWLRAVPRTHFSQGALYEIGSAMSLFQIKNFADEFLQVIQGKKLPAEAPDDPATVAHIARDIEANTRDFILKRLGQALKGHPLAEFVAHLLGIMGYQTRVSPEGPDGGIDIIAHKDELGFEPPIIKVQVKSSDSSVGDPVVTALYGKVSGNEFGLFVTLGSYTQQARTFARSKSNLRLIDGEELVTLILEHYEQFESQYKGLIPLKKVWVPEALEEAEE